MLRVATLCVQALRRILRRLLEMRIGDLKVVLSRHWDAVAEPLAHDMDGVRFAQFGFTR